MKLKAQALALVLAAACLAGCGAVTDDSSANSASSAPETASAPETEESSLAEETAPAETQAPAEESSAAETEAPEDDSSAPDDSSQAEEVPTPYTKDQLLEMAQRYYLSESGYMPEFGDIEEYSGNDIASENPVNWAIQLYDLFDGHTSTAAWYFVDDYGLGVDILEQPVDLSVMDKPAPAPEAWDPVVVNRQVILDTGSLCGVAYIGTPLVMDSDTWVLDEDALYDQVRTIPTDFDFLKDLPRDRLVSTPMAFEIYVLIPGEDVTEVVVEQYDPMNDVSLRELYHSRDNAPFVLACNYSDIAENVKVTMYTGSDTLSFGPKLSNMDGRVLLPDEALDLTGEEYYAKG